MIRKFGKYDTDSLIEIWKNENIKAHNFISEEYWERNCEFVKEAFSDAEIYVYVIDGKNAGFIGLNNNYIEGIFVDTKYQSRGIGTVLLNKAKEIKNNLTLNVYKKNTKAIDFYRKNGFEITAEGIDKETNEEEYTMVWDKLYFNK